MISSKALKEIVSEARPIIERQLDDADMIAGLRDVVADAGGDWSTLKALIKAQIQDERDETGNGKRVKKILDKAGFSTDYASLLGWSNMNEKNFSADEEFDPITGEFLDDNVSAKLVATVATGMQTEAGRAALTAAVDIMIAREEAEEDPVANVEEEFVDKGAASSDDPASRASEESERQRASMVGFADDCRTGGKEQLDASAAPVGDAAAHAHGIPDTSSENDAVAAVATVLPSDERVTPHRSGSAAANAGGDHVTAHPDNAATADGLVRHTPSATFTLRPNCLRPERCAGHGTNHCHACKVAARESEAA